MVPEKEEIIKAIKSLKNGKSPGHDNLNAELSKADQELAETILQPPFAAIWEEEEVPGDWTKGRREHSATATTGMALHCSLYQARSLPRSSSSGSQMLSTVAWGKNRQALGKNGDARIRSSHCAASLNSALNGTGICIYQFCWLWKSLWQHPQR